MLIHQIYNLKTIFRLLLSNHRITLIVVLVVLLLLIWFIQNYEWHKPRVADLIILKNVSIEIVACKASLSAAASWGALYKTKASFQAEIYNPHGNSAVVYVLK